MLKVNKPREEQEKDFKEMAEIAERILGVPCHKCSGSGYEYWHKGLEQYCPCQCVIQAAEIARQQSKKSIVSILPEQSN